MPVALLLSQVSDVGVFVASRQQKTFGVVFAFTVVLLVLSIIQL